MFSRVTFITPRNTCKLRAGTRKEERNETKRTSAFKPVDRNTIDAHLLRRQSVSDSRALVDDVAALGFEVFDESSSCREEGRKV